MYYKASTIFPTIGDIVVKANVFDVAEYLTDKDLWKVSSQHSPNSVTVTNIVTNQVCGFKLCGFQLQDLYLISRVECDINDGSLADYYLTPLVKAKIYDVVVFRQDDKYYIGIIEKISGIHAPSATVRLQVTGERVEVLVERLTLVSHHLHLERPITLSEARFAKAKREEEKEAERKEDLELYGKYANVDASPEIGDDVVFETSEAEYCPEVRLWIPSRVATVRKINDDGRTVDVNVDVNYDNDITITININELYYVGNRKPKHD